ncbi:MAG: hypothetical protein Kow0099_39340 [Candidatus Abyssubacteria bacterium]
MCRKDTSVHLRVNVVFVFRHISRSDPLSVEKRLGYRARARGGALPLTEHCA